MSNSESVEAGEVEILIVLDDQPGAQVGKPDADRVDVDVGDEHASRLGTEPHQPRRPAADRAPDAALVNQAEGGERGQPIADHGAAEMRLALEVEPCRGLANA